MSNCYKCLDLRETVLKLKPGVGFDGMHANHLKIPNDKNLVYKDHFFNISLAHG